jgi:hypothetical protein
MRETRKAAPIRLRARPVRRLRGAIEIPETFARSTIEREGEPGAVWLGELPGIVEGSRLSRLTQFADSLAGLLVDRVWPGAAGGATMWS